MNPKTHQLETTIDEDDFEVPECQCEQKPIDELSWDYYYPPMDANGGWREIDIPLPEGLA